MSESSDSLKILIYTRVHHRDIRKNKRENKVKLWRTMARKDNVDMRESNHNNGNKNAAIYLN